MSDLEKDNAKMITKISADLDRASRDLDEQTRRALKVSRYDALSYLHKPRWNWLPATGFAAAVGVVVLVFGLVRFQPVDNDIVQQVDDISLLSSGDDLELYENLEFYQWLQLEERTS